MSNEPPFTPELERAILVYIEPKALSAMIGTCSVNRSSILKIACLEAFMQDKDPAATAILRERYQHLCNTGWF